MSAAREVILEIQGVRMSHQAVSLAMMWPTLAARLADLCDEHEMVAPDIFRTAQRVERADPKEKT